RLRAGRPAPRLPWRHPPARVSARATDPPRRAGGRGLTMRTTLDALARLDWVHARPDWTDLGAVVAIYVATVAAFRVAFGVVGEDNGIGLFLVFGVVGLLVLGVAAPTAYNTIVRRRPIADLGVGTHRLRASLALGVAFGAVQASSLWG